MIDGANERRLRCPRRRVAQYSCASLVDHHSLSSGANHEVRREWFLRFLPARTCGNAAFPRFVEMASNRSATLHAKRVGFELIRKIARPRFPTVSG